MVHPSRRARWALLRMRGAIDGIKKIPHPEEAAERLSRRTHRADEGRVRPPEIEARARSTDRSIRQIQKMLGGRAGRGIVGEITKRARSAAPPALCSLSRSKPRGR